jgi:hypothetical protein
MDLNQSYSTYLYFVLPICFELCQFGAENEEMYFKIF